MEYGLLGLIHLALVIWAVLRIFGSSSSTGAKVLWMVLVIAFPVVGFIIWFIFGPK
jgi:hypothetical protein